jgi:XXXCH domain-containing protein
LMSCSNKRGEASGRQMEDKKAERRERSEYSQLKKRMRADLRRVGRSVRKGRPPDADMVRRFCADSRLMTTYQGRGDEYYSAFLERVDSLTRAAEGKDPATLEKAISALEAAKKDCHKRFR